MTITIIGVGKMGLPMASHLLAAGHAVSAFDNNKAAQQQAQGAGLHWHTTIEAACSDAAVIMSSLPHDAALLAVGQQVAAHAQAGTVYIDTSTVSLQASAEVAQSLAAHGIAYVRAPVSGNNKMAQAAQLTVMASGPLAAYEQVKPLLQCFGPTQFYLGDAEQARLMKLVINLMIAVTSGMLSEALNLGRKGGLDWQQMWEVMTASAIASPIVKAKATQLREHDYTPTFTVHQMVKDLSLILSTGAQLHVPLALTASVGQQMQAAIGQGDGELDFAAIIRALARNSGMEAL